MTPKTRGNPFFLGEFLHSMHAERLIYLDPEQSRWRWKTDEIERSGITDNVADLMGRRFEQLEERTRHVLELASCIGERARRESKNWQSGGVSIELRRRPVRDPQRYQTWAGSSALSISAGSTCWPLCRRSTS
jgi:hypothetical protein